MMNYNTYTTAESLILDIYKFRCQDCVSFFQGLSTEDVTHLMEHASDMDDDLSKQAFGHSYDAALVTLDIMEEIKREGHEDLYNKVVALNMMSEDELKALGEQIAVLMGQTSYAAMSDYASLVQGRLNQKLMAEQYRRVLAS